MESCRFKERGVIFNGDCVELMDGMIEDNYTVDLTVTSPPYDNLRKYNGGCQWDFEKFKQIAQQLYQVTAQGGVVVWVVGDATRGGDETGTPMRQALYFKEVGFRLHDTMIYEKVNPLPQNHNRYEQCWEYMFVLSKGAPRVFNPIRVPTLNAGKVEDWGGRKSLLDVHQCRRHVQENVRVTKADKIHRNIFQYPIGGGKTGHPAVFPLQLAIDQILTWSQPEDTVFDPFIGSGTTAVAAQSLNRRFVGCELVRTYYDMCCKRIEGGNMTVIDDPIDPTQQDIIACRRAQAANDAG